MYLRSIQAVLTAAGKLDEFSAILPERFSSLRWYPLEKYLVHLAVGGALLASPECIHEGMYEIGRRNAVAFAESLLGRAMIRFLSREPSKLLQQACAARRQSTQYGRWEVEFHGPKKATVHMFQEYMWIESNLVGAARGTFESIGYDVDVVCELSNPFEGKHLLSW
jgi:uncharacterized protein (TIGR02265 family)